MCTYVDSDKISYTIKRTILKIHTSTCIGWYHDQYM